MCGCTEAGPREWLALAVIVLPVLLISIDNTVLTFALPQVSVALRPSGEQLMWLVDIYPLMLAGLLIAAGSLGDRVGRRRLLLIGAVGFGVASVGAAFSPTAEALIAWRALLGVFGATLMPSTLSLIRTVFVRRDDRRLAIAVWAATFAGGAALGPVMGGYLLEHLWWGSVFLVNVPIIAVLLAAAPFLVPESRDPHPGRIDVSGIAWSMTAMLPFVYGIKQLAEHGLSAMSLGAMALGVVGGLMFVRRQVTATHPLIDVGLFSDRVFSGAIGANLLSMVGYAGFLFFAAQFLQLVVGLSPMAAATVLIPGLVVTIVAGLRRRAARPPDVGARAGEPELRAVGGRLRDRCVRGHAHDVVDHDRVRRARTRDRLRRDAHERRHAVARARAPGGRGLRGVRDGLRDRRRAGHRRPRQRAHRELPREPHRARPSPASASRTRRSRRWAAPSSRRGSSRTSSARSSCSPPTPRSRTRCS